MSDRPMSPRTRHVPAPRRRRRSSEPAAGRSPRATVLILAVAMVAIGGLGAGTDTTAAMAASPTTNAVKPPAKGGSDAAAARAAEEARRRAAAEAQRRAAEEARRKAAADAQRRAAEDARRQAAADAQRRAAEEARRKAAADAQRRAAEDARQQAAADAQRRAAEAATRQRPGDAGIGRTAAPSSPTGGVGPSRPRSLETDPVALRDEAARARRAELARREQERRTWILQEQERAARDRAARTADRDTPGNRIATTGVAGGSSLGPSAAWPAKQPTVPGGKVAPETPRLAPPLRAPVVHGLTAVGTTSLGPAAAAIRPAAAPRTPVEPPAYGTPEPILPPPPALPIDDGTMFVPAEPAPLIAIEHADVTIWAPQVDLVCHDPWPVHHGWHSWVHPHHVSWVHPVSLGWHHDWSWSWSISLGFGHHDWWFGFSSPAHCFPYVPVGLSHWHGVGWWHDPFLHRPHVFGGWRRVHWHRPHVAWFHDVCRPRTTVIVRHLPPPPPPSLDEAWDAMSLGRIGRAADLFELILEDRPGHPVARIGLALSRARLGDIDLAAADLRRGLEAGASVLLDIPRRPGIVAELGVTRSRLRDRLRIDPEDRDALLVLAAVLERLDEPAAAYHAVDRAIDLGEVSTAALELRVMLDEVLLLGR